MASLTIAIGPLTATRQIDNAKAQTIANLIFDMVIVPTIAPGDTAPVTAQAKLQAVVDWVAVSMRDRARAAKARELAATHQAADAAEIAAVDL
jgi:hypothetical protein